MRKYTCWLLGLAIVMHSSVSLASEKLVSLTLDNDFFIQQDDGYTNGVYMALYERELDGYRSNRLLSNRLLGEEFRPFLWLLPKRESLVNGSVNVVNIGQTMFTPEDISADVPSENDIPYSAMMAVTSTYIELGNNTADSLSLALGVVGPIAQGESSQKFVHKILGSDEPKGWDTQLSNEVVFQIGRGRVWRSWVADNGRSDILATAEGYLGTIQSSVTTGLMYRYGRQLHDSYPSALLMDTRTTNPIAINGEWYAYAGLQAQYIFNQIFADGNTFRDSRSVSYDHDFIGLNVGVSYSWKSSALTFAINRLSLINSNSDIFDSQSNYGTVTYTWKI